MTKANPATTEPAKGVYFYADMVRRYIAARDAEKQARAAKEAAAADLRALLDFWCADSIECEHGTASYKNYEQTRLDQDAARAAGVDLDPFMIKKAYERLNVA